MKASSLFLLFASLGLSQAVQYSTTLIINNPPPGNYDPNFISHTKVVVNGTTYSDSTASVACPGTAQIVLPSTNTCVTFPSATGVIAFWLVPGNYQFTLQLPAGQFLGPFPFSTSGTSPVPQFPQSIFVINVDQLPVASSGNQNFVYLIKDGQSSSDCTVGGGSTRLWCVSTGSAWVVLGGGSGTSGVSSFNTRTGTVTSQTGDYTAAQVTNAVSTLGSYPNPAWITALAATKLTGNLSISNFNSGSGASSSTFWRGDGIWSTVLGVTSFNTRTGAVVLNSGDIIGALGYTPANVALNLSDLSSASTARSNLGLGALAVLSVLPNPSSSTLGGIESITSVTHKWINSISTSGVPSQTQPTCGDLSDSGSLCTASSAAPSGSAGGDLGGTYPNPTVLHGTHITDGSIPNSGLAHDAVTINSTVCTLGTPCTITAGSTSILSNWIDPVTSFNAAGNDTRTTGTVGLSSTALTLASGASWSSGMGINVVGAGAAGANLITTCTTVVGTACTLAAAASTGVSGAVVKHDDTAAIQAAYNNTPLVHLRAGTYNLTSSISISVPGQIIGDGQGQTFIQVESITNTSGYFNVSTNISGSTTGPDNLGVTLSDFTINQDSSVTPTSGYGVYVASGGGGGTYVTTLKVSRISFNNTYAGVFFGTGAIQNWIEDLHIRYLQCGSSNCGIVVNSPSPSGDTHWVSNELNGPNSGLLITNADTQSFTGLKVNNTGIIIAPQSSLSVRRIRFIDASIEGPVGGGGPTCGVNIGTNNSDQISFTGGGVGIFTDAFCVTNATGVNVTGMFIYGTTINFLATSSYGSIIGNTFNLLSGSSIIDVSLTSSSSFAVSQNVVEHTAGTLVQTDSSIASVYNLNSNINPNSIANNLNAATKDFEIGQIFNSYQFGSSTAISGIGKYIQTTYPSALLTATQSGAGTSGSPFIDAVGLATFSPGAVIMNATGSPAAPTQIIIPNCPNDGAHAISNPSFVPTCSSISGGSGGGGISGWGVLTATTFGTSATQYAPWVGGGLTSTTETIVSMAASASATISALSVSISATLGTGTTLTVTLEDGTATPTALSCVTSSGGTSCADNTHAVTITKGDLISFKLVAAGTVTSGLPVITISYAVGTSNVGVTSVFGNSGPSVGATGDIGSAGQVLGVDGVPLCSGFTPTNGQVITYTTGGSPNPCYAAVTPTGGSSGSMLASFFTTNSETTASGSPVDLSTPDTITFSLSGTTDVVVTYMSYSTLTNDIPDGLMNQLNVDGTLASASIFECDSFNGTGKFMCGLAYKVSLGSGSHTIKVQHFTSGGSTGSWTNRLTQAFASP